MSKSVDKRILDLPCTSPTVSEPRSVGKPPVGSAERQRLSEEAGRAKAFLPAPKVSRWDQAVKGVDCFRPSPAPSTGVQAIQALALYTLPAPAVSQQQRVDADTRHLAKANSRRPRLVLPATERLINTSLKRVGRKQEPKFVLWTIYNNVKQGVLADTLPGIQKQGQYLRSWRADQVSLQSSSVWGLKHSGPVLNRRQAAQTISKAVQSIISEGRNVPFPGPLLPCCGTTSFQKTQRIPQTVILI